MAVRLLSALADVCFARYTQVNGLYNLVGHFFNLLAYGFVSPLARLLEQKVDESTKELQCVKVTLLASMQGYAPAIAVEFGRKVLYSTERPGFAELEAHVKGNK